MPVKTAYVHLDTVATRAAVDQNDSLLFRLIFPLLLFAVCGAISFSAGSNWDLTSLNRGDEKQTCVAKCEHADGQDGACLCPSSEQVMQLSVRVTGSGFTTVCPRLKCKARPPPSSSTPPSGLFSFHPLCLSPAFLWFSFLSCSFVLHTHTHTWSQLVASSQPRQGVGVR